MNRCALIGLLAGLAFAAAASQAAADCKLQKIVDVPVTMDGLHGTVPAQINGHDTRFTIDTGAFFSVVGSDAAAQFGMRKSSVPFGMVVRGVGGSERDASAVTADTFTFAGAGFKNIQFLTGGRVDNSRSAGVIGQNVMGPFDVEYDFANGVMRFFKAEGCAKANLAYWSSGMALSRAPLDVPGRYVQAIIAKAKINGRLVRVQFDSGAPVSYLSRHAAARAGIQIGAEGVTSGGLTYGVYGKGLETFLAPFQSFSIGDEEIKNTQLRVADIDLGNDTDMLVGADFFLSHRILVSNSQKTLYFTYNGGPVFRLDRTSGARQVAQAEPSADRASAPAGPAGGAAADKAASSGAAPATAAELARRGAASAARRDFPAAIADFGRAIELEPQNAAYYHARALARLGARQPILAMSDLDQALKYDPKNLQALATRGELYLRTKDTKRAQADFDEALKLAPANSELPATVGLAYARAGMFDLALHQIDAWIGAHPKDENLARGLSARCWVRALANRELDAALADCDSALRKDRNSQVMTYRGLVLYRMGRLDEAVTQYAVAIRAQPRAAMALYLRGLAEEKKGDKTDGDADLAAARAIAPNLAQEYRQFGLAPDAASSAPKAG